MNAPAQTPFIKDRTRAEPAPRAQLILGLIFGVAFGFLLQKGGVAKYDVLMGSLLLTDFTVFKIMITAIATGMVGIFTMHHFGLVKLHVKATKYAANILGGFIFGIGMALFGYCPGTGSAALGQGNYEAGVGILGLMAGSYLFAEMSGYLESTIMKIGDRGKLILPELVGVRRAPFIAGSFFLLILFLFILEFFIESKIQHLQF